MLQFLHFFFFLFQPRDSALQQHQSRVIRGADCSSGFRTVFLGQDLNMGTGTGIKSSRNKCVQCSATLRMCTSGDIEAVHGGEIMANESKTGN